MLHHVPPHISVLQAFAYNILIWNCIFTYVKPFISASSSALFLIWFLPTEYQQSLKSYQNIFPDNSAIQAKS